MHYYSVNGERQNSIAINDRAIAYGDGIFTTAKIINGQVEFLSSHITRLVDGCRYLKIDFNDPQTLTDELEHVAKKFPLAVLKVIITAGSGGRGYSRTGVSDSQIIISIHSFPEHYNSWSDKGISLSNCNIKLGLNPILKGLKHLNRLEQVLIRNELDNSPADDFLVCDLNGFVVESSAANIFWLRNNKVYTPIIDDAGVNGVYRQNLITFSKSINQDVIQIKEKTTELNDITGMFLCNSVMGIVPVYQYQDRQIDIESVLNYRRQFLSYCR
jgi:4-amino-4-deoxychorismate lyase